MLDGNIIIKKNFIRMKKKILLALIINGLFFYQTLHVFFTKGISGDFVLWRFLASLAGVIVFGGFVVLLIREYKKHT